MADVERVFPVFPFEDIRGEHGQLLDYSFPSKRDWVHWWGEPLAVIPGLVNRYDAMSAYYVSARLYPDAYAMRYDDAIKKAKHATLRIMFQYMIADLDAEHYVYLKRGPSSQVFGKYRSRSHGDLGLNLDDPESWKARTYIPALEYLHSVQAVRRQHQTMMSNPTCALS